MRNSSGWVAAAAVGGRVMQFSAPGSLALRQQFYLARTGLLVRFCNIGLHLCSPVKK